MDIVQTIALTMGIGWASGLNLYAAVFMLGLLSATGDVVLPEQLAILSQPLVLLAAGIMYCVEFFADKTPGLDTGWDAIHTFIRIPAGAIMAMGAVGDVSPAAQFVALLVGGTLAAGSHALKAGSRIMINTSPEPFSNWTASISEDLLVIGGLWTALNHPAYFLVGLTLFILLSLWLLPRIWSGIIKFKNRIAALFAKPIPDSAIDLPESVTPSIARKD
jgi:hypothetical protein